LHPSGVDIPLRSAYHERKTRGKADEQMDTSFGIQQKGKRNLITDVAGITVGHCTLADGDVQTGVTVLLPHQGDLFHDRCPAAVHVINGFGKSAGLVQVQELGYLETPLILTNTLSVGTAFTACVRYMLTRNDQIGRAESTVNPVILECNDGYLNDIRGLHVTEDHVFAALDAADTTFALGAVGAGRGMSCYHLKGGIGSASRVFEIGGQTYTLGALAMTNFGSLIDLTIAGERIGKKLAAEPEDELMLQGVVDCAFRTEEGLVIVDFKTDRIRPEEAPARAELYRPQLTAYSQALSRVLETPVAEMVLYFFAPGCQVTL